MRKKKILVADDITENIDILISILQDDYAIIVAKDGEKAVKIAHGDNPPDLILMDIMMPIMDGYEACMRLKGDPVTHDIPIIFTTALDGNDDEERGLRLGAVDYITKPFHPALIKARILNQLELKRHRDHLQELVNERTAELVLTQDATIYTLANLAETRDPETGGHIRRTQTYVKLLAEELQSNSSYSAQLDSKTIELLYKSAPLHDIGKVGVPDAILLKPGKLTNEEFDEMKRHSEYGRNALNSAVKEMGESSFLKLAEEIAYTHHEKWDGNGYPQGLKGEDIPLSGRLMAIADVYDALISIRPYKKPFTHEESLAIIKEGRGKHFDPVMTDAFLAIHESFQETAIKFMDSDN